MEFRKGDDLDWFEDIDDAWQDFKALLITFALCFLAAGTIVYATKHLPNLFPW